MYNNKKNNTHKSRNRTYQSQKKVSWAMKLLPISFFSKIIHFLLKKIKCYTSHLFFPCHLDNCFYLKIEHSHKQKSRDTNNFFSFGFTIYNVDQTKKHNKSFLVQCTGYRLLPVSTHQFLYRCYLLLMCFYFHLFSVGLGNWFEV